MIKREFLKLVLLLLIPIKIVSKAKTITTLQSSTFKYIYLNPFLKRKFFGFLKTVFNLYPENEFHNLINKQTIKEDNDKKIYLSIQNKLDDIDPFLSSIRYQLPALWKQKEEMAKQTYQLLKKYKRFNGYLEIGSSGRYLDYLEEKVYIYGKRYYSDVVEPGYSIVEMIDRGQIPIGADFIAMNDYKTNFSKIKSNSLDLVTVYIGFHHCPLDLRKRYILSIKRLIRKGGKLILRDHDCDNDSQKAIVSLAHDVFNLGTNQTWDYNSKELRNFYSLDFIISFVCNLGFEFKGKTLFQKGDPTKNALMLFEKK